MLKFDTDNRKHGVIFDIDGTLADLSHRLHHVKGYQDLNNEERRNKDWNSFNAECDKDLPKHKIIRLLNFYKNEGFYIILVTGRNEGIREKTEWWLMQHDIHFDLLLMRPADNYESDCKIKEKIYKEEIEPQFNIELVIDDRQRVVDMWRNNGLTCLQCQKGDY